MSIETIEAIRAVRLASHELFNVCAAMVGGTAMAMSLPSAPVVGQPLAPCMKKLDDKLDKV